VRGTLLRQHQRLYDFADFMREAIYGVAMFRRAQCLCAYEAPRFRVTRWRRYLP